MKFNWSIQWTKKTTNLAGGEAYTPNAETALYAAVVTAGLSDTFYETTDTRLQRIRTLMAQTTPEFAAKLAIYTRSQMHLRSVPLVLAVELARQQRSTHVVRKTVRAVVQRADEITELLGYYQLANNRQDVKKLHRLSKQVQKGLADAFNQFDEYQFAKYNRTGSVRLRDALFLVHPKPTSEAQQQVFHRIANNSLAVPYTWETELTALGQKLLTKEERTAANREVWQQLIDSGKLGYMALLRNLRNIILADVSGAHIEKVCRLIADPVAVAQSKQLPFRFQSAWREVSQLSSGYVSAICQALEDAVAASASSIAGFDGNCRVLIACDVSGSMQRPISRQSRVQLYDVGLVLAQLLQRKCLNVVTGIFGDTWKILSLPGRNILANAQEMRRREGEVGYSTNGYKVIDDLIDKNRVVDKVMMFTDCQLWDSTFGLHSLSRSWARYKTIAPGAKLYLFDLAGYGTTPISTRQNDVYLIAGWSDKIFDVLHALDNGLTAVGHIHKIDL